MNRILRRILLVLPRKESPCFPWIRANGCHRTQDHSSSSLVSSSSSPSFTSPSSSSSNSLTSPQSVLFQEMLQPQHSSLRASSGSGDGTNGMSSVFTASEIFPKQQETDQLADQLTSGGSNRETSEDETSRQVSDQMSLSGNDEKSRMIELIPVSPETGPPSSATASNSDNGIHKSTDVSRNLFQSRIELPDREPQISPRILQNIKAIAKSSFGNRQNSYKAPVTANTVTQASGKRGFDCIRKCIVEAGLHPVQCHSIC